MFIFRFKHIAGSNTETRLVYQNSGDGEGSPDDSFENAQGLLDDLEDANGQNFDEDKANELAQEVIDLDSQKSSLSVSERASLRRRIEGLNIRPNLKEILRNIIGSDHSTPLEIEKIKNLLTGDNASELGSRQIEREFLESLPEEPESIDEISRAAKYRATLQKLEATSGFEDLDQAQFRQRAEQLKQGVDKIQAKEEEVKIFLRDSDLNLSNKQVEDILSLEYREDYFDDNLTAILKNQDIPLDFASSLETLKQEQTVISQEVQELTNQIGEVYRQIEDFESMKQHYLRSKTRVFGIKLAPYTELDILQNVTRLDDSGNPSNEKFWLKGRIKDVKYVVQEENIDGELMDPELKASLKENGFENFGLDIEFEYTDRNGKTHSKTYNEKEFKALMQVYRITEEINSADELASELQLTHNNLPLEEGMVLEYKSPQISSTGSANTYDSVTIQSIDHENHQITLDKEILVHPNLGSGRDLASIGDQDFLQRKTTLSFAEFLKWQRQNEANKQMTLDELQQNLVELHPLMKDQYPDGFSPKASTRPIRVKPGEFLRIPGLDKTAQITGVSDEEVTLSTGENYPFGAFYDLVKDWMIEAFDPPKNDTKDTNEDEKEGDKEKGQDEYKADLDQHDKMPKIGPGAGVLGTIWNHTTFLSLKDIFYTLPKMVVDNLKQTMDTKSQKNFAKVFKDAPVIGADAKAMGDKANKELVNSFKEAMEVSSISQIRQRMYITTDSFEFYACADMLSEKGALRVDHKDFKIALNRIGRGELNKSKFSEYQINEEGGLNNANLMPDQAMQKLTDEIFGANVYSGWTSKNDSTYKSAANSYADEVTQYQADVHQTGGVAVEVHNMLTTFLNGDDNLDVGRYSGFLRKAIEEGFMTIEERIYYLMAGISMVSKTGDTKGQTLLSEADYQDMLGTFKGTSLPFLSWFMMFRPDPDGPPMPYDYLRHLMKGFGYENVMGEKSTSKRFNVSAVKKFLQQDVLPHFENYKRVSRAVKNTAKMDHDDMAKVVPYLTSEVVNSRVVGVQAGGDPPLSEDGYAAGFTGFTDAFVEVSRRANLPRGEQKGLEEKGYIPVEKAAVQMIEAFNVYESVLGGRHKHRQEVQRLNFNRMTWDGLTVKQRVAPINKFIAKVVRAYSAQFEDEQIGGVEDIEQYIKYLTGPAPINLQEKQKQSEVINGFPSIFRQAVEDNGSILTDMLKKQTPKDWGQPNK